MPQVVIFKPQNCYPPLSSNTGIGFDRLRLKPGANPLSDEAFSALAKHPSFQSYVGRKALIIQDQKADVEPVPLTDIPQDLTGYNVDEADEIIDKTNDLSVLQQWLSRETRITTKRDLDRRIKDLEGGDI